MRTCRRIVYWSSIHDSSNDSRRPLPKYSGFRAFNSYFILVSTFNLFNLGNITKEILVLSLKNIYDLFNNNRFINLGGK